MSRLPPVSRRQSTDAPRSTASPRHDCIRRGAGLRDGNHQRILQISSRKNPPQFRSNFCFDFDAGAFEVSVPWHPPRPSLPRRLFPDRSQTICLILHEQSLSNFFRNNVRTQIEGHLLFTAASLRIRYLPRSVLRTDRADSLISFKK